MISDFISRIFKTLKASITILFRIKLVITLLMLISCQNFLSASEYEQKSVYDITGIPFLKNYSPEDYGAHGQNWGIIQDKNGFMYFANTEGCVLQYDGVSWRQIPVSNGSIVRSLAIDSNGVIYVGAQNEIGYLAADSIGNLQYISLLDKIDESFRNFGNVWQICVTTDHLYFSTRKYLFQWDFSGNIKTWEAQTVFHAAFLLPGDQLFIHEMERGLKFLDGDSLKLVPGGEQFNDDWIYVVIPASKNRMLIGARKSGLYFFDGVKITKHESQINKWLIKNQVYHGITLQDGGHVLTTIRGGVVILDKNGKLVSVINKESGLLDENVWSVYQDVDESLWLATNRGLAHIEYPSPFSLFDERKGLKGNVQDIVWHKNQLYVATGLGVFTTHPKIKGILQGEVFEQIPGLKSQCWSLLSFGHILLVSCNHGIYEITNGIFNFINPKSGWTLYRSQMDSNRIYIGLDAGVASLYKTKSGWIDEGKLPNIEVEARTLAEDSLGRLWIGTVYNGVLRVDFNYNKIFKPNTSVIHVQSYSSKNGLPSKKYNLVFKNGTNVLFGMANGIYHFEDDKNTFLPINFINQEENSSSEETSYTLLKVDDEKNIWFNIGSKPALASCKGNDKFELTSRRFLCVPEASIYCIFPGQNGITYFGGTNGIIRYQPSIKQNYKQDFHSYIRQVIVNNDSTIFWGTDNSRFKTPILPYHLNAFRFQFASPYFTDESANRYSYILEGFDDDWSKWTTESTKDYTNIPEGEYVFKVMTKNVFQNISNESSFNFIILPPWYRTIWAYLGYLVSICFILYYLVHILINRVKRKAIAEQKKIEGLRTKIAADLHDDIGAGLTEISIIGEVIAQKLPQQPKQIILKELDIIRNTSNNLINDMSDIVWLINPKRDSLFDLISRLADSYKDILDSANIKFETENLNSLKLVRLKMEYRQHLFFIFKEALSNSLKYSNCREIFLGVKLKNKKIKMQLKDDGNGFENTRSFSGNGLKNMQKRAEEVKGTLTIKSSNGNGTEVIFDGKIN